MKYNTIILTLLFAGCTAKLQASYPSKPPINGDIIVEQVLASTPMLINVKSGGLCTAVAIGNHIALTARHCVEDIDAPGQLFLTNLNHELHTTVIVYPNMMHDIAVISVMPPFSKWITADIMDPLPAFTGEPVSSYGYGCTPEHVLTEHANIVEQPHAMIGDGNFDYILLQGLACPGDSGGPVIRASGKVMGITVTRNSAGTEIGVTPVWVDGAASWPGLNALL